MTETEHTYTIYRAETSVVWFDLDDTLIDFKTNSRRALSRLYNTGELCRLFGSAEEWIDAYEHYNHLLWSRYSAAEIDQATLRMDRFRLPLAGAGADDTCAREMSARFDSIYLDYLACEKEMVPGALRLLNEVRRAGFTTGILSNGFSDVQHRKINNTGIAHLINIIVLSDDIGVNKPDVRLFHHAMELSGVSEPKRHLMIRDNPDTDIAGAAAAGWKTLLLSRDGARACNGHTPAVSSLDMISVGVLPVQG